MALWLKTADPDFEGRFSALLAQKREQAADVNDAVAAILARVRAEGDSALIELTRKFDGLDLHEAGLRVSEAEIDSRVPALLGRLVERFQPRLAVIACNTASTIALDEVRSALDLPVVGTVPAIKPAAEQSRTRVIGVLGTEATVRQPYVDELAAKFAADCTIIRHGSPELVELAEAKLAGESVEVEAVRAAPRPMFDAPGGGRVFQPGGRDLESPAGWGLQQLVDAACRQGETTAGH